MEKNPDKLCFAVVCVALSTSPPGPLSFLNNRTVLRPWQKFENIMCCTSVFLHASFITTALLGDNNNVPAPFPGTSPLYSNIHSRLSTLSPLHAQLIMATPSLPFSLLSSLVSFPSCLLPPSSWLPNSPNLSSPLSHYSVVLSGFLSHDTGAIAK